MKKLISSLALAASLLPTTSFAAYTIVGHTDVFEQKLGYHLPTAILNNTIEPKVRENHTNQHSKEFYKRAFDTNMLRLRTDHLSAWFCATGKDKTKCVSSFKRP